MPPQGTSDWTSKLRMLEMLSCAMDAASTALRVRESRSNSFETNFPGKRPPTMDESPVARKQARYDNVIDDDALTEDSTPSEESSMIKNRSDHEGELAKKEHAALRNADPFSFYSDPENRLKYYMFEDDDSDDSDDDDSNSDDEDGKAPPTTSLARNETSFSSITRVPLMNPSQTSQKNSSKYTRSRRLSTEAHPSMHFTHMFEEGCKL